MEVWVLRRGGCRQMVWALALSSVLAMAGCSTDNSSSSGGSATATPTFSPGAGTYNKAQTVTISNTTSGAVLYCTTDGSTPTASSTPCSQPTTVYKTAFLQAIAVAPGKTPSAVASAAYTINYSAAATPTFSPAGGTYLGAQTVTINDGTSGANLYYTLDGTVPTVSSTLYTGPVAVSSSATLSAIAVASGYSNSGVATAQYVISSGTQAPLISPAGGTFSAAQSVTIADGTPGAIIYYTVDGSTPTSNSTVYSSPITVSANATISAIAIASGVSSTVTTAAFVINVPVAAAPTFSPGGGTYSSAQQVSLSSATQGATIYYTVDNSNPTTSSTKYTGTPISISTTQTIKAIAVASGYSASSVASATYTISNTVAPPIFSPAGGTYTSAQQVSLSSTTQGATIYYTVDNSNPTTSSTKYTGTPINVGSTETINAIAVSAGNTSTVASATYTINAGQSYNGKVMSGTQPVVGASVQMYVAGQSGYGSSATLVSTAVATTGADGSFTFNYNCPAAPANLVYVVAIGGHAGSSVGSNAGLAFMAALGPCNGTLPNPLVVNEVTTVASAYALAQFMTGAANVGSSLANYQQGTNSAPGLAHAFGTITNLVDLTTGQARDHTPAYPTNLAGDTNVLNNSTVPRARINALANTLNACAADNSKCSSFFSAATPPSGTSPSNTLQAILNIAQNPGNQPSVVYGIASGSGPFAPALSAAPNDWTLALTFTGGGLGFARSAQVKSIKPTSSPFTNGVFENTSLAIDATGNVWTTGFTVRASNTSLSLSYDLFSGMVAKFDNLGNPLTPASSLAADGTPTYGGFVAIHQFLSDGSHIDNAGTIAPRAIAIDPSGNTWVTGGSTASGIGGVGATSSGGAMTEITPGLSLAIPWISLGTGVANAPIAIDGVGNVWTSDVTLQKFDSTGTHILSNDGTGTPGTTSAYAASNLGTLIFDANATSLWASGYTAGDFFQIKPADGSGIVDYTSSDGIFTNSVPNNSGNVYACRQTPGQTLGVFNASSTTAIASYPIATGRGCGQQMVVDGLGHLFTITGSPGSTITPGIIDEFSVSSTGITAVTPSSGYTGTSSGEAPTINGDPAAPRFVSSYPSPPKNRGVAGAAIDGSGNLWVLNVDTGTTASTGNVLVEFIGIAAPVVTPNSLALQFGQVGVRP